MLFSEQFGVKMTDKDDWLDIIIDADTPLFVDPFLIFRETAVPWNGAHAEIISHFEGCFNLIVAGSMKPASLAYKKAVRLLKFKEPKEFCLGYTAKGTDGAGGGDGYAKAIARAMVEAIQRGLADLQHFEELGILDKGIGRDRIGDLTCNILKSHFIAYTKEVAARHKIATVPQKVLNSKLDGATQRWVSEIHELPQNPVTGNPILLIPARFVRIEPTLNARAWFEDFQDEQLRNDASYEILNNVNKETIVKHARANAEALRNWVEAQAKDNPGKPYDLEVDSQGVYRWDPVTRAFATDNPLKIDATDDTTFFAAIDKVVDRFKHFIEEQRGWKLLWNEDGADKHEEAAQLVFFGLAREYLAQNGIVLDREVELGRGPVDFKFSNGYQRRALLEIKKLHSGKFWNGLKAQLPSYLLSDDCEDGWYVAVQYRDAGTSKTWAASLPGVIDKVATDTKKRLRFSIVDARKKASASTIKPHDA